MTGWGSLRSFVSDLLSPPGAAINSAVELPSRLTDRFPEPPDSPSPAGFTPSRGAPHSESKTGGITGGFQLGNLFTSANEVELRRQLREYEQRLADMHSIASKQACGDSWGVQTPSIPSWNRGLRLRHGRLRVPIPSATATTEG